MAIDEKEALPKVKISILTATYNSESTIFNLIDSLSSQTTLDFEWVIADGGSTDKTLDLIRQNKTLRIRIDSRPDFGIYDALNRAIKLSEGDYYLTVGSDDILYPNAISDFKKHVDKTKAKIISANVFMNQRVCRPRGRPWLFCMGAYVSCHAVGTLIKKDLHHTLGLYSRKYPLAADQLFLKKVCDSGVCVERAEFISGEFGDQGISSKDILGTLTEIYRIQIQTGENKLLQTIIFILRLIRNFRKI